jgi:hypothetical protein
MRDSMGRTLAGGKLASTWLLVCSDALTSYLPGCIFFLEVK